MDADDIAHPARLSRQVDFLYQHAEVAVVGSLVKGVPQIRQCAKGFRVLYRLVELLDHR